MRGLLSLSILSMLFPAAAFAASVTITSPRDVNAYIGQPFVYQITADNVPTSFSVTGLSAELGSVLNKSTGAIIGVPKKLGTYHLIVKATGNRRTAQAAVTIVITKMPVSFTNPGSAEGSVGQLFTFQVSAPIASAEYTATGLPVGVTIDKTLGTISGKPLLGGDFAAIITAMNDNQIATQLLTFGIHGSTQPPEGIALRPTSGTAGTPYSGAFTVEGQTPFTISLIPGLPPGLALSMTSNGNFLTGTPTQAGQFVLAVTAANARGSTSATIILNIASGPNSTPTPGTPPRITSPLTVNAEAGSEFSYTFAASGAPSISFTADQTQLPRGLVQVSNTLIAGTPFDPGIYQIPISAANAAGADNEILTINVASLPAGDTSASITFTDTYHDNGKTLPTSSFRITALLHPTTNVPQGVTAIPTVRLSVGLFTFSAVAGLGNHPGQKTTFRFSGGNITFTAMSNGDTKIVAHYRGRGQQYSIQSLLAAQLAGKNHTVNETIPVQIQTGLYIASFYANVSGTATTQNTHFGAASTVRLKGTGSGTAGN